MASKRPLDEADAAASAAKRQQASPTLGQRAANRAVEAAGRLLSEQVLRSLQRSWSAAPPPPNTARSAQLAAIAQSAPVGTAAAAPAAADREFYETWIEHPDGRAQFAKVVAAAVECLAAALPKAERRDDAELVIGHRGQTLRFDSQAQVWVGRHADCDVALRGPHHSRRQFALVPFRNFGVLALVPLGGLASTAVKQRSSGAPCEATHATEPRVLVFEAGETVELELSPGERLTLNPKLCVVCEDRARSVALSCGHFATCTECTAKLADCPLCRAPIGDTTAATFCLHTCAK